MSLIQLQNPGENVVRGEDDDDGGAFLGGPGSTARRRAAAQFLHRARYRRERDAYHISFNIGTKSVSTKVYRKVIMSRRCTRRADDDLMPRRPTGVWCFAVARQLYCCSSRCGSSGGGFADDDDASEVKRVLWWCAPVERAGGHRAAGAGT